MVCPKAPRHFEPVFRAADHNHFSSSGAFRDCERGNAHRPGSLHHDGVAPANSGALDSVDGGDERAPGSDHGFCGEGIRQLENVGPGPQVMKLSIAAEEVGWLVALIPYAVSAPLGTTRRLPLFGAIEALATRRGRGPGDAVANLQGLTAPIQLQ